MTTEGGGNMRRGNRGLATLLSNGGQRGGLRISLYDDDIVPASARNDDGRWW
jgi:hypothetical protein